ncbi:hypothetical protein [Enterovibrio calviensis]|uniref:hypothetical protein n=1 Tax=Enterovibrio calviensis TaxID=91359 RepID=UPI000557C35C|nr:hypothetical protein [Enterovibrio calviensis]
MTRGSESTSYREEGLTEKETIGLSDRDKAKPSVLFLCDGEDGYSLVAQSILTHKADSYFRGFSAYTSNTCNVASACQALRQYNITCSDQYLSKIEAYKATYVDYLIALSPSSVQSGKPLPEYAKFIPWDVTEGGEIPSSFGVDRNSADRHTAIKYINDQINYFLSVYLYR